MSTKFDRELVKKLNAQKELLAEFGLRSYAYDPGVACYDSQKRRLDFGSLEWEWLRPLLEELHLLREGLPY